MKQSHLINNIIKLLIFFGIIFIIIGFAKYKEISEGTRDYVQIENDVKISQAEYSFYQKLILEKYKSKEIPNEINFDLPLENQVEEESGKTYQEILDQQITNFLKEAYTLQDEINYGKIAENNKQKELEFLSSLEERAKEKGVPLEDYIKLAYGKGISKENAISYYLKYKNTKDYLSQAEKDIPIEKSEIWEYYKENKAAFDIADFIKLTIPSKVEQFDTQEMKDQKMKEAEKITKEIFDQIYDEKTLNNLAKKYEISPEHNQKFVGEKKENIEKSIGNWVFEEGRNKNTLSILKNSENGDCYIFFFLQRYQNPDRYPSIYIGNIPKEKVSDLRALEKETVGEEAFLKKMESAGIVLQSFDKVKRNMLHSEFDQWVFQKERSKGDIKIFPKEEEYVIVYFRSFSEMEAYKVDIETLLKESHHKEYLNDIYEKVKLRFLY